MGNKVKAAAAALTLSISGIAFITVQEGKRNVGYYDAVGVPTSCVGHTGPDVVVGKFYSDQMCADLLRKDTKIAQADVKRLVTAKVTQKQYDALVSFTFNVGGTNLASSTLLKKVNAGDCLGAVNEFPRWNRAKGIVLPGLVKRRAAEAKMWRSGC